MVLALCSQATYWCHDLVARAAAWRGADNRGADGQSVGAIIELLVVLTSAVLIGNVLVL